MKHEKPPPTPRPPPPPPAPATSGSLLLHLFCVHLLRHPSLHPAPADARRDATRRDSTAWPSLHPPFCLCTLHIQL